MERRRVEIRTETIAVDALLKFAGVADTGGEAKQLIQSGLVRVNGVAETRRGRRLAAGDGVQLIGPDGAVAVELEIAATPEARDPDAP